MRLDVRRIENVRGGGQVSGQRARISVVKNKCAPPYRTAVMELAYDRGLAA